MRTGKRANNHEYEAEINYRLAKINPILLS